MITKTYLDAKLSDLEEKFGKRIDFKVGQAVQRRESEISRLKDGLRALEEKIYEREEMDEKQDEADVGLAGEFELLKSRVEKLEELVLKERMGKPESVDESRKSKDKTDTIIPDEI